MNDLLSRVRSARDRYCRDTGEWPDQIFLGPAEYMEFKELLKEYATFSTHSDGIDRRDGPDELMGMTIIGLMSDGVRAGHTVA